MSEAPKKLSEQYKGGPDFFGFYACQIADLLSEDENVLSMSNASELSQGKYGAVSGKDTLDCSCKDADSLFQNSIVAGISDFKKGRLKGLLRQSVNDLSMEVDEMLDPVVAMSELRFKLRSNNLGNSALDGDADQAASKKLKLSSSCSSTNITGNSCPIKSGSCKENEDDLEFLLKNDNQLLCRYGFVPEELTALSVLYTPCYSAMDIRPMTRTEKRQLQKMIQQLPNINLVRLVEIIQRGRPTRNTCGEEIFVDLETEENATLWRLYYYVEAVEKAKMLAQLQFSTTPTL
ncbi:Detected protein of unknown function [Hibiscus syriacus]|uniref:NET domain-containing protein n=1 Tax=Hibiscus syriacus TaxID=106335 RepID=A0A6A2ZUN1_HIBSY|nr:Detected protein of unknown function [Hibiscus syriacus]